MTNLSAQEIVAKSEHHHTGAPEDWRRFFGFSTDHKVIGIQYIVTSFFFFLVGGIFAMIVRGELITLSPSGICDYPAHFWHFFGNLPGLRPQAPFWLQGGSDFIPGNCRLERYGLGTSHVC